VLTAEECSQIAHAVKKAAAQAFSEFVSTIRSLIGAEYLDRKSAAIFMNLSVSALEQWKRKNYGPQPISIGQGKRKRIVYKRADITAFIESNRKDPSHETDPAALQP
jgi:hypothetical protein